MPEKPCAECKHDKPYDQWLTEIRMCLALGVQHRKSRDMMRTYGECGADGKLFQPTSAKPIQQELIP